LIIVCFLSFIWGFTIGPIFIATNTIVHLVSDKDMQGKVFSAIEMVIHAAFLMAMLLSSWLAEMIDHGWILSGIGAALVVAGWVGLKKIKKTTTLAMVGSNMA